MKDAFKLAFKLFIITFISGALLGGTYFITKDPIEQQTIQAADAARKSVLAAASFEQMDISEITADEDYAQITDIYIAKDESGAFAGATIGMLAKGFKPGIVLTVGINADGTISGIDIGNNDETPGLGANAKKADFYGQYAGKPADGSISVIKNGTPAENEITAISGATITSRGITDAVNTAAECYNEFVKDKGSEQ